MSARNQSIATPWFGGKLWRAVTRYPSANFPTLTISVVAWGFTSAAAIRRAERKACAHLEAARRHREHLKLKNAKRVSKKFDPECDCK